MHELTEMDAYSTRFNLQLEHTVLRCLTPKFYEMRSWCRWVGPELAPAFPNPAIGGVRSLIAFCKPDFRSVALPSRQPD